MVSEKEIANWFETQYEENIENINCPLNIDKTKFIKDKIIENLQTFNLIK